MAAMSLTYATYLRLGVHVNGPSFQPPAPVDLSGRAVVVTRQLELCDAVAVRWMRLSVRHQQHQIRLQGRSISVALNSKVRRVVSGLHLQSPGLSLAHE